MICPLAPGVLVAAAMALVPADEHLAAPPETLDDELDPMRRDNHHPYDATKTAAFVAHLGYWTHRGKYGQTSWPFPMNATCDDLGRLAKKRGVLRDDWPSPGDILLRWSETTGQFVRASIVVTGELKIVRRQRTYLCDVVEGRLERMRIDGVANDWFGRLRSPRRLNRRCCPELKDAFVRWVDLDKRNDAAMPQRKAA
jgi:hypothetical protein